MLTLDGWQKLDRALRSSAPFVAALILTLLGMVPLRLTDFGTIAPSLALMAVFYWGVYRPDLLGPVAAGLLGFVHDVLSGAPLGLYTLVCLVTYSSVVSQRQLFLAHSFFILWWGYALTALLAGTLAWLISCLLHWGLIPFNAVLFQAVAGIALFPPVAWLLGRIQRGLLSSL
jgi:rod shape-determining protein MreD